MAKNLKIINRKGNENSNHTKFCENTENLKLSIPVFKKANMYLLYNPAILHLSLHEK